MRRPVLFSFLVEATATVVLVTTFKIAGDRWGAEAFGAWTLARRILAFALPLTTVGVETSLARHIAFDPETRAANYLLGGAIVVALGIGAMSLVFVAAPDRMAGLLFGDASFRRFLTPLWALLVGYPIHILFFEYMRGHLRIMEANALHLWAFAAAPLLGFGFATRSPEQAMSITAGFVAVPAFAFLCFEFARHRPRLGEARALVRKLAAFGTSRMLSSLVMTGLALLPPLFAAQSGGLASAGAVALGITLIGFAGALMAPLALTLMPATARQTGRGDSASLERSLRWFQALALPVAIATFVCIWFLAPFVAELFLASEAELARRIVRIAGAGAGSYAVFIVARSLLDATMETRRVFHCTLLSSAVFMLSWVSGRWLNPPDFPTLAMTCYTTAIVALAASAYVFARRALRSSLTTMVSQ